MHTFIVFVLSFCDSVFAIISSFCRAVLRITFDHSWHDLRSLGVVAYRKITDLKPVYRNSYDTHGLSLLRG